MTVNDLIDALQEYGPEHGDTEIHIEPERSGRFRVMSTDPAPDEEDVDERIKQRGAIFLVEGNF